MSSTSPSPVNTKPEAPGHPADASDPMDQPGARQGPGGGVEEGPEGDAAKPASGAGLADIGTASNIGVDPPVGTGVPNAASAPEKGPQGMATPTAQNTFDRGPERF